jgi:PAS domain S-box-containing protein
MKPLSNRSVNTTYNFISSLLLVALFLALSCNNYRRNQALILKGAIDNARIISRQIIETREYLSRSVTSEPEQNPNLIPQVAASRVAQQLTRGSGYSVRQVSLRYRNPDNRPDEFETNQLTRYLNREANETWQVTNLNGRKLLRYLLPMAANSSCLTCHGSYESAPAFIRKRFPKGHFSYGYRVGEVIGAISVSVPMEELYQEIGDNFRLDLLYNGVILAFFIFITGWIIRKTILTPMKRVALHISDVASTGNFSDRLKKTGTNEINELIGSFNDLMAELDRRTKQRVEAEDRYRNFIEIARSPIISFMADGKILIANQKAETLFGLTQEELIGLSIFEFMEKGEDLRLAMEDYFSAGSSDLIGTTTRQRVRNVCGAVFPVEMVVSVSQSDQSLIFSAILRTVT